MENGRIAWELPGSLASAGLRPATESEKSLGYCARVHSPPLTSSMRNEDRSSPK
jgi:hypothetical protein